MRCRVKRCAAVGSLGVDGSHSSFPTVLCNAPHTHGQCQLPRSTLATCCLPGQHAQCLPTRSRLGDQRAIGHPHVSPPWQARGPLAQPRPFPFEHGRALSPLLMTGSATVVRAFLVPSTRSLHLLLALPPSLHQAALLTISPLPTASPPSITCHPLHQSYPSVRLCYRCRCRCHPITARS